MFLPSRWLIGHCPLHFHYGGHGQEHKGWYLPVVRWFISPIQYYIYQPHKPWTPVNTKLDRSKGPSPSLPFHVSNLIHPRAFRGATCCGSAAWDGLPWFSPIAHWWSYCWCFFFRGCPTDSHIIQTNVCQNKGLAVSGMMGSMTLPPPPKAFATVSVDVGLAPRDCAGGPPFFSK